MPEAPRIGDYRAGQEQPKRGRNQLYESARDGFGHMPERRGRVNILDVRRTKFSGDGIKSAADHLLKHSG